MIWLLLPLIILILLLSLRYGLEVAGRNEAFIIKFIVAGFRFKARPLKPSVVKPGKKEKSKDSGFSLLRSLSQGEADVWHEFGLDDLTRGWRIFKLLKHGFRLRVHQLDVTIATPDPSLTGILFGSACAIRALLPPRYKVRVWADFAESLPAVLYRVEFSFIPLILLFNTLRAAWFVPFRKIARLIRKVSSHSRVEEVVPHA